MLTLAQHSALDDLTNVVGHVDTVEVDGRVVAAVEWEWVATYDDVVQVDRDAPHQDGAVAYLTDCRVIDGQGLRHLRALRRRYPQVRYLCWRDLTTGALRAPGGLPHGFFGEATASVPALPLCRV